MPTTSDERIFAVLIYVSSFFTAFIGPLIIWLLKKESSAYVNYHGKHYFNFLISYFIYGFIAGITVIIGIGLLLVPIVAIAIFVFTIIAAIKAYEGEMYQIPFTIRFF